MRNPLSKRYSLEFKKNAGRYICIFLLLVITILIGSGFLCVMESVKYSLDEYLIDNKVEDAYFETAFPLEDNVKNMLGEEDIVLCDNYYSSVEEFDGDAKVYVFNERNEMNIPALFEGKLPTNGNEIAVDRLFAQNHDIAVGDSLELNKIKYIVSGTISLPDYSSLFLNNQDLVMNTTGFGVCMVSEEGFDKFDKSTVTYRYSYRHNERNLSDKEKVEAANRIHKLLVGNGVNVQDFLIAQNNQSIIFLQNDMGKDGPVMEVLIYILIVIMAFVFAVLSSHTIEEEAPIIGTLRSMGYKKWELILHYITPTIIVTFLASVVGNALGYTVMIEPFKRIYYTTYCLPPLTLRFNQTAFIKTTIIPVVIMIVVNLALLINKMSLAPLRFLRKDLKKRKQKKAAKLPNLKFISRFRIRVILQNKGNYLVLFFGIFLSSFLLMFGIGLQPLMDHYVDTIDDTLPYEYQYILKAPVEAEGGEKVLIYSLETEYYLTGDNVDVTFYGVQEDSQIFNDFTLPTEQNHIVVSDSFAKKLNVNVGDEIIFEDTVYEKKYTLVVDTISPYTNNLGAYMSIDDLCKLLEKDAGTFNCYASQKKLDIDDAYIAKLMNRSDFLGAAKQMMISFGDVITIVNVFSVFAYLVLMYLLTKIVIDKNSLYISFMKVFGYEKKEIRKLYLDASAIVTLVSLLICLPLEAYVFKMALVYISSLIEGYMDFYLPVSVYVKIVITGALAYFVINALHLQKVKRIPMNEALKNRE
ncbi:MAG TPA: ABC transporter permease [Clostridium sp.]|nr:ABC transporter permease [Clostridium sp.]